MKVHSSITPEMICAVVEEQMFGLDNLGFCVSCGHEQEGCEPDAAKYECEECGERAVYGAEQLLIMGEGK